jgi:hypothetical protein
MNKLKTSGKKQKAAGKLTLLVFGTVAFVLLYSAYYIMPFYYYFYELQNQFESHAKAATMYTNKQLREKLMYHINRMEIPIDKPEDLKIERSSDRMKISLFYTEIFYITFRGKDYTIHTFDFEAKADEPLK